MDYKKNVDCLGVSVYLSKPISKFAAIQIRELADIATKLTDRGDLTGRPAILRLVDIEGTILFKFYKVNCDVLLALLYHHNIIK